MKKIPILLYKVILNIVYLWISMIIGCNLYNIIWGFDHTAKAIGFSALIGITILLIFVRIAGGKGSLKRLYKELN